MTRTRRPSAGFTLLELMVTMAIAAVLMLVAAPNFIEYRRNSELADAVSNFVVAAGSARSAALKSGRNVFLQANDTTAGWTSGWFVYVDNNWDNDYDADTDEVVTRHEALTSPVAVTAASATTFASGYLMFNGAGFPRTTAGANANGSVTMATSTRSTNVVVDNSGRVRSCKTGTTGC